MKQYANVSLPVQQMDQCFIIETDTARTGCGLIACAFPTTLDYMRLSIVGGGGQRLIYGKLHAVSVDHDVAVRIMDGYMDELRSVFARFPSAAFTGTHLCRDVLQKCPGSYAQRHWC